MKRGQRKTAIGIVTSDKMDKTITVESERRVLHPRFRKHIKASTRYKAHDENNDAREGDQVLIVETRPLSKTKRWRLLEILKRSHGADIHQTEVPLDDAQPPAEPQPEPQATEPGAEPQ